MQKSFNVIPAEAGIQVFQGFLDPGLRRGDVFSEYCKRLSGVLKGIPQNDGLIACRSHRDDS